MQKFSFHTHTTFSDGANSLDEMLSQAVALGWTEIGISDHFIAHKNVNAAKWKAFEAYKGIVFDSFEMAYDVLSTRFESIRKTAEKYPIKVSVGLEVDFFTYDGWEDELRNLLSKLKIDHVINGNHFVFDEKCQNIINLYDLGSYIEDKTIQKEYMSRHFKTIKKAIESKLFKFIAHIDYARMAKDLCGEFDYKQERLDIIKALADNNMPTELSTKGLRIIGDFYPARWMLNELKAQNVPLIISDDAHSVNELGKDFDKAEALLAELSYTNRLKG